MQLAQQRGLIAQPIPKFHVVTEDPLRQEILSFLGKRHRAVDNRGVEYFTLRLDNKGSMDPDEAA
jgi:hypothetical protein